MLYLSGIILSFFLAFLLITKRNKTNADYILFAWMSVTGFHLFTFYLFYTHQYLNFPTLVVLGFPLPLAHGPFLYLYTSRQTSPFPFNKKQLLHFTPVILSYLAFTSFYIMPFEQRVEVMKHKGQGFEMTLLLHRFAIYISGTIYTVLSLIRLLKYRKNLVHQFSNTDKINFNWLLYLIIWMMVIWMVVLIMHNDRWIYAAVSLFVLWIGYFSIRQVQVFRYDNSYPQDETAFKTGSLDEKSSVDNVENITEPDIPATNQNQENVKYQKSPLSEKDVSMIYERLKQCMNEKKPFINPDLTLNDLAKSLEVHPNHLSQVINSNEHKNFYDLINEKRIQEFIQLISQSSSQKYTLMALAYDCGFNSKASFNRNFKKYTGVTPSDYLKNLSEK
jgi:AraC-like DNA-binding protein